MELCSAISCYLPPTHPSLHPSDSHCVRTPCVSFSKVFIFTGGAHPFSGTFCKHPGGADFTPTRVKICTRSGPNPLTSPPFPQFVLLQSVTICTWSPIFNTSPVQSFSTGGFPEGGGGFGACCSAEGGFGACPPNFFMCFLSLVPNFFRASLAFFAFLPAPPWCFFFCVWFLLLTLTRRPRANCSAVKPELFIVSHLLSKFLGVVCFPS